jgi:hypothetical protein
VSATLEQQPQPTGNLPRLLVLNSGENIDGRSALVEPMARYRSASDGGNFAKILPLDKISWQVHTPQSIVVYAVPSNFAERVNIRDDVPHFAPYQLLEMV